MLLRLRFWLIRLLAGRHSVGLNLVVSPWTLTHARGPGLFRGCHITHFPEDGFDVRDRQ